ncbi:N-alpha-acetyltransferase 30A [Musca vetustissima]|uniref:N-alpha-acetyltransferase 30A n=1 Tax=Musca vetustissima TaxID=27455 RepID=UPI002AB6BAFC|nr:N-alpha-acetyltransferase 30A [Musca vetustissima]
MGRTLRALTATFEQIEKESSATVGLASSRNESSSATAIGSEEDQLSQVGSAVDINGLKDQLKQQLHIGNNKVNGLVIEKELNSNNNCTNSPTTTTLNGHHQHHHKGEEEADDISLTMAKKSKRKPNNKKNPSTEEITAENGGDGHLAKETAHQEHLQNGFIPASESKTVTGDNTISCNNTAMTPKPQICEQKLQTTSLTDDNKSSSAINETTSSSSSSSPSAVLNPTPALDLSNVHIEYKEYESELQMHDIMRLIQAELSEPYSIYTYRYFIYNWPKLCFLAAHGNEYVGAIVCKLDMHMNVRRGYIAMLAVRKEYRKLKIGTTLVQKAIEAMLADNADEVVLETEMSNLPALRLYENLGFVRDKRLFRYYLNGVDALRLKLWFR